MAIIYSWAYQIPYCTNDSLHTSATKFIFKTICLWEVLEEAKPLLLLSHMPWSPHMQTHTYTLLVMTGVSSLKSRISTVILAVDVCILASVAITVKL